MSKVQYGCIAPEKEMRDHEGKSLGMQGERALFYSPAIYRDSKADPNSKFKMLTHKTEKSAQEVCDEIIRHTTMSLK